MIRAIKSKNSKRDDGRILLQIGLSKSFPSAIKSYHISIEEAKLLMDDLRKLVGTRKS